MAKIIERPMYLQALEEVKQTPDIKIWPASGVPVNPLFSNNS